MQMWLKEKGRGGAARAWRDATRCPCVCCAALCCWLLWKPVALQVSCFIFRNGWCCRDGLEYTERDASFPRSLPFSYHLPLVHSSSTFLLSRRPLTHPSICPRSPVTARSGSDKKGCCGKGSQVAGGAASQPE